LIIVEDFGKAPRFNFEKISSKESDRCVLAVGGGVNVFLCSCAVARNVSAQRPKHGRQVKIQVKN
jgi:hypothetical protein